MEFGLDTVIVAVIGAVATIYGIREARAGRKDAVIQQEAANRLLAEKQELEGLRAIIDAERAEVDRAHAQRDEARVEAERERNRRIETETALRLSEQASILAGRKAAAEYAELLGVVRGAVAREAERTEQAIEAAEGA